MLLHLPPTGRPSARCAAYEERARRWLDTAPRPSTPRLPPQSADCPCSCGRSLTWDQGGGDGPARPAHDRYRHRRCTSATRTHPGSGPATRTPTVFCANTFRREQTCHPLDRRRTSRPSPSRINYQAPQGPRLEALPPKSLHSKLHSLQQPGVASIPLNLPNTPLCDLARP